MKMALFPQSSGVFCLLSVQTALLVSISSPAAATLRFPQHYTMIHWAGRIEKELEKVLQLVTGGQQMKGIYSEKRGQFDVERNTPKQLVEKVAGDIARLLYRKRKALERLAREAEYIQREHSWQDVIKENDIQYYDSKADSDYSDDDDGENLLENPNSLSLEFVDDPNFKNKVNYSYTAVQIPTDIYKGSTVLSSCPVQTLFLGIFRTPF